MEFKKVLLLSVVVAFLSCQNNNDIKSCGDSVVIGQELFLQDSTDSFTVTDAFISGNCITVEIGASGCDPTNWIATLVTDGLETNSIPPSRMLRLKLTTNEACLAYFTPEFKFYLGSENQTVIYSLEGWPDDLVYNY